MGWPMAASRRSGGKTAVEPQNLEGPYVVRFWQGRHEWSYAFSYYRSAGAASGYIVLPEPPESRGFVHSAGWYRSSDPWSEVMSKQLSEVVEASPNASWIGELMLQRIAFLSTIIMFGLLVVVRRQPETAGEQGHP